MVSMMMMAVNGGGDNGDGGDGGDGSCEWWC